VIISVSLIFYFYFLFYYIFFFILVSFWCVILLGSTACSILIRFSVVFQGVRGRRLTKIQHKKEWFSTVSLEVCKHVFRLRVLDHICLMLKPCDSIL
jgi:hypothetical protein